MISGWGRQQRIFYTHSCWSSRGERRDPESASEVESAYSCHAWFNPQHHKIHVCTWIFMILISLLLSEYMKHKLGYRSGSVRGACLRSWVQSLASDSKIMRRKKRKKGIVDFIERENWTEKALEQILCQVRSEWLGQDLVLYVRTSQQ